MNAAASSIPGIGDADESDRQAVRHALQHTAERALLDDLAAYARETRGFVEDSESGSGYHARQLRALLLRHQALVAAR